MSQLVILRESEKALNLSFPTDLIQKRKILVNWLIEVHFQFGLKPETIVLAIFILDKFLSVQKVGKQKLQLFGAAAYWIASKYEDVSPPEISDFVYICADQYTEADIREAERVVANTLQFRFSFPTPFHFLQYYFWENKPVEYDIVEQAYYFLLLALLDVRIYAFKPSMIAAACVLCALLRYEINPQIAEIMDYTVKDLEKCVAIMYEEHASSVSKYKSNEPNLFKAVVKQMIN